MHVRNMKCRFLYTSHFSFVVHKSSDGSKGDIIQKQDRNIKSIILYNSHLYIVVNNKFDGSKEDEIQKQDRFR